MRYFSCLWNSRLLFLFGSAIGAFVLRALPYRNYLGANGEYILGGGPDSYDHLRRIVLGVKAFPGLPPFDYYYGYPQGTGQVWAPLFDYVISTVALLLGAGQPSLELITAIGFWLPPALSFFTVFLVYDVGARLFGRAAGLVAAFLIAILPAHITYSHVSDLDHHVAEPMVCLFLIGSLLRGMQRVEDGRGGVWQALPTACAMLFALLIWRGSVIFWGIVFLALFLQVLCLGMRKEAFLEACRYALQVHLYTAILLLPICAFNPWRTAGGLTANIVSWFHVILLLICALIFYLLGHLSRGRAGTIIVLITLVPFLALISLPVGRTFVYEFVAGLDVIVGSDPWLSSISELHSILFFSAGRKLNLRLSVEMLSLIYLIFPILFFFILHRWRNGGYREFRYPLFLVWGGVFWLLPLFRIRYCHLTAVTIAIGGGLLFTLIKDHLNRSKRVPFSAALAVGAILLLIAPVGPYLKNLPQMAMPGFYRYDLMDALRWLRDNTPTTSFYNRPTSLPEYGVLADWALGAYIVNVARRPTVATNFGWETHGLYDSAAFQAVGDPMAAAEILRANRVRYIILSQSLGNNDSNRAIVRNAVRKGKYLLYAQGGDSRQESMYYRLLVNDGGAYEAGAAFGALGHYRLIYESWDYFYNPGVGKVSDIKIFEYLPGAIIKGIGPKGGAVTLEIRLKSPNGRVLTYRDRGVAGFICFARL